MHASRVLVVEDDPLIRETLREILGDEGYRVVLARTGAEALALIQQDPPDLILLELNLTTYRSEDVVRLLQSWRVNIPVVAMSVSPELPPGDPALPIDGYLAKPFELDALLDVVGRFCSMPNAILNRCRLSSPTTPHAPTSLANSPARFADSISAKCRAMGK